MVVLRAIKASLDSLTRKVQCHEEAPEMDLRFGFDFPPGSWELEIKCDPKGDASTVDQCLGAALVWHLPTGRAELRRCVQVAINAWKGARVQVVAEDAPFLADAHTLCERNCLIESQLEGGLLQWSVLRRLVLDGYTLQATITIIDDSTHLGLADGVHVACIGQECGDVRTMLQSDVSLRVGGKEIQAHRFVLAAASPVFLSMLGGDMQEGRAAVVEVGETTSDAVELLLDHIYGSDIEVPLPVALQLYALADRYQLKYDLAQQLRLWLSTANLQLPVLIQMLPAAHTLCPAACTSSMYWQAAHAPLDDLKGLSAFHCWPLDVLFKVVDMAPSVLRAFEMSAAWVEAQSETSTTQRRGKRARASGDVDKHCWPDGLLAAIPWDNVEPEDLEDFEDTAKRIRTTQEIPGLFEQLFKAACGLCSKQQDTINQLRQEAND